MSGGVVQVLLSVRGQWQSTRLVSSPQCDDTAPNELLEDAIQCTKGQLWGDGEQQ